MDGPDHRRGTPVEKAISQRRPLPRTAACGLVGVATGLGLVVSSSLAYSGPCTAEIAQLERQVAELQATTPASGAGTPTAAQSVGAQLHHQPTRGSVQHAEKTADTQADAELARAKKADAANDAALCTKALEEARRLYGID